MSVQVDELTIALRTSLNELKNQFDSVKTELKDVKNLLADVTRNQSINVQVGNSFHNMNQQLERALRLIRQINSSNVNIGNIPSGNNNPNPNANPNGTPLPSSQAPSDIYPENNYKAPQNMDFFRNQDIARQFREFVDGARDNVEKVEKLFSGMSQRVASAMGKVAISVAKVFSVMARSKAVENFKKSLVQVVKNSIGIMTGIKPLQKALEGFSKSLHRYAKMMSLMIMRKVMQAIIKNSVAGFNNVVQYSEQANADVSRLWNSMRQLGNAMGASVAPIFLHSIIDALDGVIQKCISAINMVQQLMALLTGATTWTKAKKLTDDYAQSLDKGGKSAKDFNKSLKIDELNVLSDNGSGGGAGGTTNPSDMFTTENITEEAQNLMDRLKEMWANADFTLLGKEIGDYIIKGLQSIPWDGIQEVTTRLGKSLATFFNGLISPDLGYEIGNTFAQIGNTFVDFFDSFGKNFDFANLGASIGTGINSLFENFDFNQLGSALATWGTGLLKTLDTTLTTIDWKTSASKVTEGFMTFFNEFDWSTVSSTLSHVLTGLMDTISGLIDGIDWKKLPQDIIDAIVEIVDGIDFAGLAKSFAGLIGNAFGAIFEFFEGFDTIVQSWIDELQKSFEAYYESFDSLGQFIWEGVLGGIVNAIANIGVWIYENILKPFIDNFEKHFEIHSPSKLMEREGEYIIKGMIEGIKAKIAEAFAPFIKFKDDVVQKIHDLKEDLHKKWDEMWDRIKFVWTNVKNWLGNTIEEIKENAFVKKVLEIAEKLSGYWDDMWKKINEVWTEIKQWFETTWNDIVGFFQVDTFTNIGHDLMNNFFGGLKSMWDEVERWFKEKVEWIKGIFKSVKDDADDIDGMGESATSERTIRPRYHGGFIPQYASGGFPSMNRYSLFTAGEGGMPEMLGTVGGRTAVASNFEITGIRDSVESASQAEINVMQNMVELLQELVSKDTSINLDGRLVSKQLANVSRRSGYSFR